MKRKALVVCCCVLLFASGIILLQSAPQAAAQQSNNSTARIDIWDYCDPDTFNDPVNGVGPGTCVRSTANGAITFGGFVNELTLDQSAGAWRFAPNQLVVKQGTVLILRNLGGEEHTFTQVKRFGGGFVPFLNDLSGNPTPAPECSGPVGPDNQFIDPGTTVSHPLGKDDVVVNYQCCVHPWMRLTVTPKNTNPQPIH